MNNFAAVNLVEAEQSQYLSQRQHYIAQALKALNRGVEMHNCPLCAAYLALLFCTTGESDKAFEIMLSLFTEYANYNCNTKNKVTQGIIYVPLPVRSLSENQSQKLIEILNLQDGYEQAILLSIEILGTKSIFLFGGRDGIRLLHIASQFFPNSAYINLKLGIASLYDNKQEGLLYLHRAREYALDSAPIIQSLYLAYKSLQKIEIADYWLNVARDFSQSKTNSLDWKWADLTDKNSFTYLLFQNELLLTVEPKFSSLCTNFLLSEGDWFENEMELWRSWLKPGMTVIDVGANVGVYTFSAALRVGSEGRVVAVEPFPYCVRCLEETCKVNNLTWVKVCAGAASDRAGIARLSIHTTIELNEILTDEVAQAMPPESYEKVTCFTLDSLIEEKSLRCVDFLKIDAEGHELSVLFGSHRLITQFSPIIFYENVRSNKGSSLLVANYLKNRGYKLYFYQPYVHKLIQIESAEDLGNNLNIIAVPENKTSVINLSEMLSTI